MPFFMTSVVFIALAVAVALAGMKLYVRPKEAMERVVGGIEQSEHMPSHPSLAFHDLIKKLGNIIPQSPKDVTVMQRRLIRAGIRNENALKILYGAKAAFGVSCLPLITALAVTRFLGRSRQQVRVDSGRDRGGILRAQRICAPHGGQAPEGDRARPAERARPAGGLRRERTGSRSGDSAGVQGTGARASRRSAKSSAW